MKQQAEARLWAHLELTWNSYHFQRKHRATYSGCLDPACVEERALLLLRPDASATRRAHSAPRGVTVFDGEPTESD